MKDITNIQNESKIIEEFEKGYFNVMNDARNKKHDGDSEYQKQQELYTKFANVYDKAVQAETYSGPNRISNKINKLFQNREIDILDFGCGTGLVGERLFSLGYTNIDGIDCNQNMLNHAEGKKKYRNLMLGKNDDGLRDIKSNTYDVVCASGVFFLSATHPGFECLKEMCRITKPGGKVILLMKNEYLKQSYVRYDILEELEENRVLKAHPKENFDGYLKAMDYDKDNKCVGALLTYDVL